MKYVMIVPDGAADEPIPALDNRTALEAAHLPVMDALASEGRVGRLVTVPDGVEPGSDVANMSLIGYDPRRYYTGRAPLELAGMGMELADGETAWRCNLVTVRDEIMEDFSAGHIKTEESHPLIEALAGALGCDGTRFLPGVGYRHLVVTDAIAGAVPATEPPHNIMGERWRAHLPEGDGADFLVDLMIRSQGVLKDADANVRRERAGKVPANMIWLWGGGTRPTLPSFRDLYGKSGAAVTAVDLVAGIAALIGWERIPVEGATAYFDTNYTGKAVAAIEALDRTDFVFVHIEAPDEGGHEGDPHEKVKALEEIDRQIVARIARHARQRGDVRILVVPDHPTPVRVRTHTRGPVPFVLWGPGVDACGAERYDERAAEETGIAPASGEALMRWLFESEGA